MKRIFSNWSFIRFVRLVIGVTGTVQGVLLKEYALSLISFFLVYMAIADVGCCGANACAVEYKKTKQTQKEMEYEEVDLK